jgi:hypothetical protein
MLIERMPGPTAGSAHTMLDDELGSIVAAICARFPGVREAEVESVVTEAYRHLAEHATLTTHLIPLTLNRSMRMLRQARTPLCDAVVAGT